MTSFLDTKNEIVCCFMRRLRSLIQMATQSLVVTGKTLVEVLYHARGMEEIHFDGHDKRAKF